jgi:hypothetical protein
MNDSELTSDKPAADDEATGREDVLKLAQRYFNEFNSDCRDFEYLQRQRIKWATGDLYIKGLLEKQKAIDIDRISAYADYICINMTKAAIDDGFLLSFASLYDVANVPVTIVNSAVIGNMCMVARALRDRPSCAEAYERYMNQVDLAWSSLMLNNSAAK